MPRVLVVTEGPEPRVLMNESVRVVHIDDEHCAVQLLERLEWSIRDGEQTEGRRGVAPATSYLQLIGA